MSISFQNNDSELHSKQRKETDVRQQQSHLKLQSFSHVRRLLELKDSAGSLRFFALIPKLHIYLFPCSPTDIAAKIVSYHLMPRLGFEPASVRELHLLEGPLKEPSSDFRHS